VTLEQMEAIRAVRTEADATRRRLLGEVLPPAERELEQERLLELTKKQLQLEEAAAPTPAPASDAAKLTPDEARGRAAGIRARAEYWNPTAFGKDGARLITREAHEQLKRELVECDARAGEPGGSGES
jgi:hypothetical protein